MTGSLQEKKGLYYVVINYKDCAGKWKQKWIKSMIPTKGNNKRKAEAFLAITISEYEDNPNIFSEDMAFIDFYFLWLDFIKHSIEPNTYESYCDIAKRYIEPYFKKKKTMLQELEPKDIQNYYKVQLDNGLSPNTVIKQHANIRKALQYAVQMNMLSTNPADRVTLPKKVEYRAKFYTVEQINSLLAECKNEEIYCTILLAAFYGLRRSEILGLKWQHVDFDNDSISIQDTVVQYHTVFDKQNTKTKASRRTLPLIPSVKQYLLKLQEQEIESERLLGEAYFKNTYVCKRRNGEPFNPEYLSRRFPRVLEKNSLPKIRFHDLRHSAASLLLANGFSLKEIQEWLGHSTLTTTANTYAHLLYQTKRNMASSLDKPLTLDDTKAS